MSINNQFDDHLPDVKKMTEQSDGDVKDFTLEIRQPNYRKKINMNKKYVPPQILESKPINETILFNQQGVIIRVHINYVNETVSFIDDKGKPMEYVFAGRSTSYLGGWVKIFRALEAVTRECDRKLRAYKESKDIEFLHAVIEMSEIED